MEYVPTKTKFVTIATGKTYPIKDELKSLGYRWNAANKVWYHLEGLTIEHYEFCKAVEIEHPELGVFFRHFELSGNDWNEI